MMSIYRWENGGLRETPEFAFSCWVNLVDPSTTELEAVLSYSQVPRDFLTDPLDAGERPRFDYEDDASLLIVHVPMPIPPEDEEEAVSPYRTVPLGIILSGSSVITVCSAQTPVTTAFLDQIRRVCPPSDKYRFAFRLLWHAGVLFLRYINDIHNRTTSLEDELHESISNEVLLKMFQIEKTLVYFTTSLKADTIALARANTARIVSHTTGMNTMRKFVSIIRFRSEISRIFSKTIPPHSSIRFHHILYSIFIKYF